MAGSLLGMAGLGCGLGVLYGFVCVVFRFFMVVFFRDKRFMVVKSVCFLRFRDVDQLQGRGGRRVGRAGVLVGGAGFQYVGGVAVGGVAGAAGGVGMVAGRHVGVVGDELAVGVVEADGERDVGAVHPEGGVLWWRKAEEHALPAVQVGAVHEAARFLGVAFGQGGVVDASLFVKELCGVGGGEAYGD